MGSLTQDRSNSHPGICFVYIVKHSELPNAKFPNRLHMLPWRSQSDEFLAVSRLNRRLIGELYVDLIKDRFAVECPQLGQLLDHELAKFQCEHRSRGSPGATVPGGPDSQDCTRNARRRHEQRAGRQTRSRTSIWPGGTRVGLDEKASSPNNLLSDAIIGPISWSVTGTNRVDHFFQAASLWAQLCGASRCVADARKHIGCLHVHAGEHDLHGGLLLRSAGSIAPLDANAMPSSVSDHTPVTGGNVCPIAPGCCCRPESPVAPQPKGHQEGENTPELGHETAGPAWFHVVNRPFFDAVPVTIGSPRKTPLYLRNSRLLI